MWKEKGLNMPIRNKRDSPVCLLTPIVCHLTTIVGFELFITMAIYNNLWYLIWILIIPCSHQRFISIFVEIGGMNFCFSNKKNLIKARFNSNFSWFYFRFGVFFQIILVSRVLLITIPSRGYYVPDSLPPPFYDQAPSIAPLV